MFLNFPGKCSPPQSFGIDFAGGSPPSFGSDRAGDLRKFRLRFGTADYPFRTGAGTPLSCRGRSGATARDALRRGRSEATARDALHRGCSEATAREAHADSDSDSVGPSTLSVPRRVHPSPDAVVRKRPRGRLTPIQVQIQIQIQIHKGRPP